MGLYLCVFDGDEELDGLEIGSYEDFGTLRDTVCERLERGVAGARFPTLMLHSDCDGAWSVVDAMALLRELDVISTELGGLPAIALPAGWRREVARTMGLAPQNLCDCFFDVDGEPVIDRLAQLCRLAVERELPILFQ